MRSDNPGKKRAIEKYVGRVDRREGISDEQEVLDISDSSSSVDGEDNLLKEISISELSLKYKFIKEVTKDSGKIYLRFIPNDSRVTLEEQKRDTAVIFRNVISVLKDQFDADSKEIRKRPNYITFANTDLIDLWSRKVGVQLSSGETKPEKTIVVIGAGDVGESVVKDLINYHERRETNCKIVWVNRTQEYVEHRIRDLSSDHLTSCVRISTDLEDCKEADMIVMTAGVKAGRIGAATREKALVHNLDIIETYSHLIKSWVKKNGSTKLAMLTNPVEISAQLMCEQTDIAPENIVALGTHLDTKRYVRFLEEELARIGCRGQEIKALVLGRHTASGMIFQSENITFGGEPITRLVDYGAISQDQLDEVLKVAQYRAREEGIVMSKSKYGKGAYEKPAKAGVEIITNWLYGPEEGKEHEVLSAGILTVLEDKTCYLGFPVTFAADGSIQRRDEYLMNQGLRDELTKVAQGLIEDRARLGEWTDYLVPLSRGMNRLLEEAEKRSITIAKFAPIGIYSRQEFESNLSKIMEIYDISEVPQIKDSIKVSVKGENRRFSSELLGIFVNALNSIGMIDKSETPSRFLDADRVEGLVIKTTQECVDILKRFPTTTEATSTLKESPSTNLTVKNSTNLKNLFKTTTR